MRLGALLLAVVVVALGVLSGGAPAPIGSSATASPAAKKRCRTVVKKVKGKKKRVRVCKKAKPKPKPQPKPQPRPVPTERTFRRVDVGGYRLAIECRGTGSPTVVLDSGFASDRSAFTTVQLRASTTTRVCTYDRAGLGQSEPRPGTTTTTRRVAEELHTLLSGAGLTGPYVLGGWSIGAFDVRYYALRYPAEVAGLVTIDGTPEGWILSRFEDPLTSGAGGETMLLHEAAEELTDGGDLGARPTAVLVAGHEDLGAPAENALWLQLQRGVARKSTNSLLVVVTNATHAIPFDDPNAVVEGIRQVTLSVRSSSPLPPCEQTRFPQLGEQCLNPNA